MCFDIGGGRDQDTAVIGYPASKQPRIGQFPHAYRQIQITANCVFYLLVKIKSDFAFNYQVLIEFLQLR